MLVRAEHTGNVVWLAGNLAVKRYAQHPPESELELLRNNPVTVRTYWVHGRLAVMERGVPGESLELLLDGLLLLSRYVWSERAYSPVAWRYRLLEHLDRCYPSRRLRERVHALPVPVDRLTHGDSTLANLVHTSRGPRWIDPAHRPYVPHDPAVDVGKLLQSCWGYERALRGGQLELADRLASELLDWAGQSLGAKDQSSFVEVSHTWCAVHLARLVRNHDEHVRREARTVLEDHYECRL